jgi:hypothetical protein
MTAAVAAAGQANASPSNNGVSNIASASNAGTNGSGGNRLNFNRLAAERKTVHVMNMNKDLNKRDKQLLSGNIVPNLATNHNNFNAITGGMHLNGPSSTLDGHNSGGNSRSQTNTNGSFLQKLSSKFTRR